MRRLHMHSKGPNFFSFGMWGEGKGIFFWPGVFHVPNLFLKMFPIAIDFLGWVNQSSSLKKKKPKKRTLGEHPSTN
jgi:hypothetical protein